MRSSMQFAFALLAGNLLLAVTARAAAPEGAPVQAVWKPVEIRYSYVGFTTAYNCDAYEDKVERILATLGAPRQTKVRASGCHELNRPSRNFFVTITTATPVPEGELPARTKSQQELLERLGKKDALPTQPFPAVWKTLDLSHERALDLNPGDCELMEGLRDHVLPKLSVKIVSQKVHCVPHQLSLQTPELEVSTLVPGDADTAGGGKKR